LKKGFGYKAELLDELSLLSMLCVILWSQTQEAVTAARALLEFTEQTVELPRDLICKCLPSFHCNTNNDNINNNNF